MTKDEALKVLKLLPTKYEMPDMGVDVIMEDCPVCRELYATMKKLGLKQFKK